MRIGLLGFASVCVAAAPAVRAGITSVNFASDQSQHHAAQFDGNATYDSSAGQLTLTIFNTTASDGGYLTALALDGAGPAAIYEGASLANPMAAKFDDLRNRRGVVKAAPFGKFDAGLGLDGKWNSPRDATRGIAAGGSETFVFDVASSAANSLVASDFFAPNKSGQTIVANFKDLTGRHHNDRARGAQIDVIAPNDFSVVSETGLLPLGGAEPDAAAIQSYAVPTPAASWMALACMGLAIAIRRKFVRCVA